MGRKIDVDDLVNAAEIASRFGVRRPQVVHDWVRRHSDFPPPVYHSDRIRLWNWPDIESWGLKTGRLER